MPELCGIELDHPVINASGTYDAIAARAVFGDAVLDDFPFAAFVSKTITPEPRAGNAPRRIWETPSGMLNSIGLPNKGLEGFLAEDLPQLARAAGAADRLDHGDDARGLRPLRRAGRGAPRGGGDRAQRLLPERALGADRRREPERDRGAAARRSAR